MTQPRIDAIDVYGGRRPTGPQPALVAGVSKVSEAIYPDDSWPTWAEHFRRQPHVGHLGGFHWLVSGVSASIQAQFNTFAAGWDKVGGMRPGEFWIVDVEQTTYNGVRLPDPTIDEVEQFRSLCAARFGPNRGLLYGNAGWSLFWQWRQAHPTAPLWYANSNIDENDPRGGWRLSAQLGAIAWQWGSPVGAVPGVVSSGSGLPCPIDVNHIFHPEWFAALNPSEDDDMPTIYKFTDADAILVSVPDPRAAGIVVQFSGSGADPKVVPWLTAMALLGAKERTITVQGCSGLIFAGSPAAATPADMKGDSKHTWTGNEFKAVLPVIGKQG